MKEETQPILVALERIEGVLNNHIDTTKIHIESLRRLTSQHSDEIWGIGDGSPGLKRKHEKFESKIEKIEEAEKEKKIYRGIVATTLIGIIGERAFHLFFK